MSFERQMTIDQYPKLTVGISNDSAKCEVRGLLRETNMPKFTVGFNNDSAKCVVRGLL